MAYHKKRKDHLCFFVVKLEVAAWLGVIFTDLNAAGTTMQRRDEGLKGINLVNFAAIRSMPRPWDRDGWVRPVQAEILVPHYIPFSSIAKVVFISGASLLHAERICDSALHPPFTIEEEFFPDSPNASVETIGFPFIDQLALSDTKIDANMLYLMCAQKNTYSKLSHKNIYLTVAVRAMVRTQANIYLHPVNRLKRPQDCISTVEFSAAARYLLQTDIVLDPLPISKYLIEIVLDNICRASIAFELDL